MLNKETIGLIVVLIVPLNLPLRLNCYKRLQQDVSSAHTEHDLKLWWIEY